MIKKLFAATALLAILLAAFLGGSVAQAETTSELSPRGTTAVQQLAACIQTAESLDIYYVIDNSLSLNKTADGPGSDPDNLRAQILAEDVQRWADIGSLGKGLTVRVNGTFFAGATSSFSKGWQTLTLSNKRKVASSVKEEVLSQPLAPYTNWLAALKKANSDMSASKADCKTVVWFTDGGLWIGEGRSGNTAALSELCGVKVSAKGRLPNKPSGAGLIQKLRDNGVSLFGVLLNNAPEGTGNDRQESYWRKYMRILVEEDGPPIPALDSRPSGEFTCGLAADGEEKTYPGGAYLEATSPSEVAYPFMLISSQVAGGNIFDIAENGDFWVDPGFRSIEILTLDEKWVIKDSAGKTVKTSKEPHSSASTDRIPVSVEEPEKWNFSAQGKLVLYTDLSPVLDKKTVFEGQPAAISGHFIENGSASNAQMSKFLSASLTAKISGDPQSTKFSKNTGVFSFDVASVPTGDIAYRFDLTLGTEHYPKVGPLTFSLTEKAQNPSIYPSVSDIKFTKPLSSGKDVISASVLVTGPAKGQAKSGEVCFEGPEIGTRIVADDQNEVGAYESRELNWSTKFAGLSDGCLTVLAGEAKEVQLQISNEVPKNSLVTGVSEFSLASSVDSTTELLDSRQFEFETGKQIDLSKAIGIFILAYLLSVGIPLIGLYFLNRSAAKIQHGDEIMRASFPVEVDIEQRTMVATSGKALNSPQVDMDEFQYRPPKDAALAFDDPELGTLKAVVPLFPLISPWYEVVAREGSVVVTGRRATRAKEARFANGRKALFDGHLGKLWALVLPQSSVMAATTEKPKVAGRLVVYGKTSKGALPNFPELMANAAAQLENSNALKNVQKTLVEESKRPQKKGKGGSDTGAMKTPSAPNLPTPPPSSGTPGFGAPGGPPTTGLPPVTGSPVMPPPLLNPGSPGASPTLPPPPKSPGMPGGPALPPPPPSSF
jgi:hypothetical protein